jgi:hypothetical protein
MKHPASSGPWAVGSNGATVKVVDADGKAVCMLTPRRDQFNGDLIAAAPALLDACQCALADLEGLAEADCFSIDDPAHRTMQELRATIAKATGVQP